MFQTNLIMTHYEINFLHKKISTGECCLESHCVSSWSLYGPKRGIPWQFVLGFSLFLLILCLHVNENHEHVQSWNPTTTKPLPGRHNNNKNRDKTNNKLGKIDWVGGIPTLNIFMVFMNKQEDIRLMETERNKCFCCLGERVLLGRNLCHLTEQIWH